MQGSRNSKRSEKKKPIYFKNTLSSHSKIERIHFANKASKPGSQSLQQTPVNRSKVMNRLGSSHSEIEEELPQMSKLFSSSKENQKLETRDFEKEPQIGQDSFNDQSRSIHHRYSITKSVSVTIPENLVTSNRVDSSPREDLSPSGISSPSNIENSKVSLRPRKGWFE